MTTSRIQSKKIKARLEIDVDSYEGKLSRKDLVYVKPFGHRKAIEIRFVDWIACQRGTEWSYRSKLKDIITITREMNGKAWE